MHKVAQLVGGEWKVVARFVRHEDAFAYRRINGGIVLEKGKDFPGEAERLANSLVVRWLRDWGNQPLA